MQLQTSEGRFGEVWSRLKATYHFNEMFPVTLSNQRYTSVSVKCINTILYTDRRRPPTELTVEYNCMRVDRSFSGSAGGAKYLKYILGITFLPEINEPGKVCPLKYTSWNDSVLRRRINVPIHRDRSVLSSWRVKCQRH